jgi:hypothetical protein
VKKTISNINATNRDRRSVPPAPLREIFRRLGEEWRGKWLARIAAVLVAVGLAANAFGHGHPIIVSEANNQLVVSGGVAGADDGYADQVYVETDSAGDPQDYADFANFGPGIYWIVPGFEISGLAENSGLYLQPLTRPVRDTNPVESRVLWYWNPNSIQDDKVEPAPSSSRMQIRQDATVNTLLEPTATVAPPAMKLAAPLAADMGYHNHDLAKYVLPYPLPPDGVYAFFARLTSDVYAPTDPFLVVINNGGLDGTQMLDAAAAINRDALLAGDYNHDDAVDAADYVVWRDTLNSATQLAADGSGNGFVDAADLGVWRNNFGHVFAGGSSGISSGQSVPEPAGMLLALIAALGAAVASTRRRFGQRE